MRGQDSLSKGIDTSGGSGRPLTNGKHEHFAHLVARGQSPAKAYLLCGYCKNGARQSGNRLLRKPEVRMRVEQLKRAVSERQTEKIALDRDWVVAMLIENVKRAMQAEPIQDREGNPSGHYTYQGGVANKALELLGKELGMFQPKPEATAADLDLVARLQAARKRAAMAPPEAVDSDSANLRNLESANSRPVDS